MDKTEELLNKITEAKNQYMQGNDIFDILYEVEQILTVEMVDSGKFGKMSKSNTEC